MNNTNTADRDAGRGNGTRLVVPRCLVRGALVLCGLGVTGIAGAQAVPMDASGGCPIPSATVASFFVSGSPTLNSIAKPADSTQFLTPNCGFFQWTEQMFLWLTSPAPRVYGGGTHIMFSPQFFTVSPESNNRRTFFPNQPGVPIRMMLRATELGPHGLPALLSRSGHVIEVQPAKPRQPVPPIVRLQSGVTVRLGNVKLGPEGALQFFDRRGKLVQPRMLALKPVVRARAQITPERTAPVVPVAELRQAIQARKFVINKIPVFVDLSGNVIDVEPGQADGGVLISQNGSLIYYIIEVNDVFAYHRSMQGAAVIPFTNTITFPMTMADASAVQSFASGKGHTTLDPQALAIETKSSWIEASAVPNPNDYLQVSATVPKFDKSNPNNWVPNGQSTVKLAMVGLHVVGSTNGHGEMVWGTFEHVGNAPDATYAYNSTTGPRTVTQNTGGTWLFTPNGFSGTFNVANANMSGASITGSPVAATPILRAKPWGSNDGGNPANTAAINTQVISANSSVISQLDPADVRRNYFQVGTTWTIGGQAPNGADEVGTNHLANATIESFVQGASPSAPSSNCFGCHNTNTVSVSHIYRELTPLP